MRMRRKKWVEPELASAAFFISNPSVHRGHWRQCFARPEQPLMVELGCGKGGFISRMAFLHPEINFIAIDKISKVLGSCKRAVDAQFGSRPVDNLFICPFDVERIEGAFAPQDAIEDLYIHFCNPWPRSRHKKHRLTHVRQLLKYRDFLTPHARLHFKTDDDGLFEDTHTYLNETGFSIIYETRDLHTEGGDENIRTEHERFFSSQAIPIKFLIARLEDL